MMLCMRLDASDVVYCLYVQWSLKGNSYEKKGEARNDD